MKNKGFTLIELIVVITILAILGTIAFISFNGYSRQTRNAKVTSDLSNLHTGLSIYKAKNGIVPMPDNSKTVVAGAGNTITYEGEIGNTVRGIIKADNNMKTSDGENYLFATNKEQKKITLIGKTEEVSTYLSNVNASNSTVKVFKGDEVLTVFDSNDNFVDADILNSALNGVTVYQGEKTLEKTTSGYLPDSCLGIKGVGYGKNSGNYKISPNGNEVDVYCDMETDGGGWTLILGVSSADANNFSSFSDPQNTGIWENSTTVGSFANWKTTDYKGLAYSNITGNDILIKNSTNSGTNINNVLQSDNCIGDKTFSNLISDQNWSAIGSDANWSDSSGAKLCSYKNFGYSDNVLNASDYDTLGIKWGEVDGVQDNNKDRVMIAVGTPTIDITGNVDSPRGIGNFADRPGGDGKTMKDLLSCNADAPSGCPQISENYYIFVR